MAEVFGIAIFVFGIIILRTERLESHVREGGLVISIIGLAIFSLALIFSL